MSLVRLSLAIPAKPENDGGPKEIYSLFCRNDRALHHPDPVVSALMRKRFDHERHETHEKNLQDKPLNIDFGVTPEIDE